MTQNTHKNALDERGSTEARPRSREWAIAALLVLAAALCWISWRIGSPLLSGIRNVDVELELRNLQAPPATPIFRVP
jgi:hypothetical protein